MVPVFLKNVSFFYCYLPFTDSEIRNASSNKLEPPLSVHRVRADNSLKCKEWKGIINLMVDRSNNLFENETLKKKEFNGVKPYSHFRRD